MMKGYDLARYLESKNQIKQLLLEPTKKLIAPQLPFCVLQEQLRHASISDWMGTISPGQILREMAGVSRTASSN
jgi:hypothetical protein